MSHRSRSKGCSNQYRGGRVQLGLCRMREHVVHDNRPQLVAPLSCRLMHSVLLEEHRANMFRTDLRDHPPASAVRQFIDAVNTPPNGDVHDPRGEAPANPLRRRRAGSTVPTGTDTLSSARINAGGRNGSPRSSRQWLQAMFVMQSRQDRGRDHVVTSRDLMSVWPREPAWQRVGKIRAEARMWSALVVESPTLAGSKDVVHSGRSANPSSRTDGANHPLAEGIRLWRSHWRLQHRQPHRRDCVVDGSGKDGSRSWMRNRWG
jgi:hypothetical protein